VDLVQCRDCDFLFYNPRLDDEELRTLYCDYRTEEYQQMRHSSEVWYTPKFNFDLASPSSYEKRRATLRPILQRLLEGRRVSRILDFGGDRGDLAAGLLEGAQAFVFDISGIPAADGVISTKDPAVCEADLTINSNVLEHVGFPRTLVRDTLAAASRNGLVFFEVPCEHPFGFTRILRRIAQIGVMALTRPTSALQVAHPAGLYLMHEHINYFTEQTLATLVRNCGGKVLECGAYPSSGRGGRADMAWCLASNSRI
jgi:Methyltransferase domain